MRWKLFATLAEAAGESEIEVTMESEEVTLEEALDALVESYPALEPHVLDGDGTLQEHVKLLCDGDDPFHERAGWESDVSDVDELALFPPVSGG